MGAPCNGVAQALDDGPRGAEGGNTLAVRAGLAKILRSQGPSVFPV
jgi:hypothetical protein